MGLFGGDDAQVTTTKPYEAQQNRLEYNWNQAETVYKNRLANGPYDGKTYASMNGIQTGAIQDYNRALGGLSGIGGSMAAGAQANLQNAQQYGQNANQIYQNYGGPATSSILARVNSYMQDPALNASINSAKSDIFRDMKENQLPAIDSNAAMGGNTNSSRTGVAEGIAMRGANDKAANIDAQMRSGAYNQALNSAQNDYFQGANTALQANNQVGQSAQMGQQMGYGALGMGQGIFQGQQQAGGLQQQEAQNQLNDQQARWEYQNGGWQQNYINDYLNTVGGQTWGSTVAAKPAGGGGWAQGALGGAMAGASMGTAISPGYGTLIGAGVGAIGGALMS